MDEVIVVNWRRLGVRRWGPANGSPMFLLHGTPGCRLSARPSEDELNRLGVRLITYDRPGYGLSDPHPGRSVADAANDVATIADALGIQQFAVLGRSGGGPHALACAALLPDRVTRVACLVGLAPYGAAGLDWLRGMVDLNRDQYRAALLGRRHLAHHIYPHVIAMRADPEHLVRAIEAQAPAEDRERLSDPEYRAMFVESIREAVSRSVDGWAADSLAFTRPWGFDLQWISAPTLLWHGAWDVFSPVSHTRWLADRIRNAVLMLSHRGSHLAASAVQHDALQWLLDGTPAQFVPG
jgi:pimeloyl-ACP methyl ester carboxylesterase